MLGAEVRELVHLQPNYQSINAAFTLIPIR